MKTQIQTKTALVVAILTITGTTFFSHPTMACSSCRMAAAQNESMMYVTPVEDNYVVINEAY